MFSLLASQLICCIVSSLPFGKMSGDGVGSPLQDRVRLCRVLSEIEPTAVSEKYFKPIIE